MMIMKLKYIKFKTDLIVIVIIIIFLIYNFIDKKEIINKRNNISSIETVASPISNKIIVLDAGHGNPDKGTKSKSGIYESDLNLKIVLKIQKNLEKDGMTVLLTRSDENGIYDLNAKSIREKKVNDMKKRVKIGNENSADAFISIHLNNGERTDYKGFQVFYNEKNINSKKLASNIDNGLKDSIDKENKRKCAAIKNKYLMNNIEIPIVIIECGFLSNDEETRKLDSTEYQNRIAWGIYIGLMNYFYES